MFSMKFTFTCTSLARIHNHFHAYLGRQCKFSRSKRAEHERWSLCVYDVTLHQMFKQHVLRIHFQYHKHRCLHIILWSSSAVFLRLEAVALPLMLLFFFFRLEKQNSECVFNKISFFFQISHIWSIFIRLFLVRKKEKCAATCDYQ